MYSTINIPPDYVIRGLSTVSSSLGNVSDRWEYRLDETQIVSTVDLSVYLSLCTSVLMSVCLSVLLLF